MTDRFCVQGDHRVQDNKLGASTKAKQFLSKVQWLAICRGGERRADWSSMNAAEVQLCFLCFQSMRNLCATLSVPGIPYPLEEPLKMMSADLFLPSMTCESAARSVPSFFRFDTKGAQPNGRLLAVSFMVLSKCVPLYLDALTITFLGVQVEAEDMLAFEGERVVPS